MPMFLSSNRFNTSKKKITMFGSSRPSSTNENQQGEQTPNNSPRDNDNNNKINFTGMMLGAAAIGAVGVGVFLHHRYMVSTPSQYIVKTGLGISDIKIAKKTFLFPYQKADVINIQPKNYSFSFHAMSNEKLEFQLPGSFTIGPQDDMDGLVLYAKRLSDLNESGMEDLIKGIIEGEARVLAARLTIEEMFSDRMKLKEEIVNNVASELKQFGLHIFNANIKELQDTPGSEYFVYMRQRKKEEAINQAKIEVAEARLKGTVGEKERQGKMRQEVSKVDALTITYENERKLDIQKSEAILEKARAEYVKQIKLAQIDSEKSADIRESEMQMIVEQKRIEQETERLRSIELSKARVAAESDVRTAEGRAESKKRDADALLYYMQRESEAKLYDSFKEAEATQKQYEAQAEGLRKLKEACGNDFGLVLQYMMIEKDLYPKLADANAKAINGLNPQITIWNQNGAGGDKADNLQPIRDIFTTLPPLLQTVQQQTGLKLPEWLLQYPETKHPNAQAPKQQPIDTQAVEKQN